MVKERRKNDFLDFMEDVAFFLWRAVACILLVSVVIIGAYEMPNVFAWNDMTDNYICAMDNFYVNGTSNIEDIEMMNEFVEALPTAFVSEFKRDWRVIVEDYLVSFTGSYDGVIVGGYTDWKSRIIFVKKQADYIDTLDIFVHELGHCCDFEYGSVSFSNEFGDIYDMYKDDFKEQYDISPDGYSTSSATEFFASCFKEYLLYPEHLKTAAPKAYDFVDGFYEDLQDIKYVYMYDLGDVANIISRLKE